MTYLHDPGREQMLTSETIEELDSLLPCLCDEVITAAGRRRLNQILNLSAPARQYYLKLIAVHSALVTTAGNYARPALANGRRKIKAPSIENVAERPVPASVAHRAALVWQPAPFFHRSLASWGVAAAVLCFIGLVVWWANLGDSPRDQANALQVHNTPPISAVTPPSQQLVAKVTYVSPTVCWQDPNASYALDSRVRMGQNLALEYGQMELTYDNGTKLLLTGPSEFVVESSGGKLRRGQLVARVSTEGHGFRIETPHGQVIDLGTEFGVVVDDFGVSQVSVFEGKVETLPTGAADPAQRIELTSGRGLQLTGKAIIPMDATGSRYPTPGTEHPTEVRAASTIAASLEHDLRSDSLPSTIGKTFGTVRPTARGLQLGATLATGTPCLITRRQFDPSQGAITIVCDVRFLATPESDEAFFAILTRSDQERSTPGLPWEEMLARFLRCSFRVDPDSGEGRLEAGTKYEADRELTNMFWGGFSRPQPDTLYRFEMRDDGLNVSFTVSLVENPSVRKTIHCRSLFRGNHNFIALEGSQAGNTVVERLQIRQEGLSDSDSDEFAQTSSDHSLAPSSGATFPNQLQQLIPVNAALLVKDDFDDDAMNSNVWTILGETVLLNGQVQLGLTNAADHIDTWKHRPYLLTKRKFVPDDGPLTIVGKVTFAENFLNGYGGSFAVMTRADNSHGNGPGWEYSILQRGVRSNFWPAALGIEHSLEIHEKPQPNTISLLAAEAFQINPRSRSYYFCIQDDGKTAMLTFIDTKNPHIHKTIRHSTGSAMPMSGHIGFESCWGSPVLLDNVRIFQSESQAQEQPSGNE